MGGKKGVLLFVLSLLLFLGGLVYLYLLPFAPLVAQDLYVDENALIPGSASPTLGEDAFQRMLNFDVELQNSCRLETRAARVLCVQQLVAHTLETADIDLRAFSSPWDEDFFSREDDDEADQSAGGAPDRRAHHVDSAVLRARRADGKESLLLVAPYDVDDLVSAGEERPVATEDSVTPSGLSMAVTLLTHLSGAQWLAKDVILATVAESRAHRRPSLEAFGDWVHQYHTGEPAGLRVSHATGSSSSNSATATADKHYASSFDFERAGNMMAALVLDIPLVTTISAISMESVGFLGVLPNLDLPSLVGKLMMGNAVPWAPNDEHTNDPHHWLSSWHSHAYHRRGPIGSWYERHPPASTLEAMARDWSRDNGNHAGVLRFAITSAFGLSTGYHAFPAGFNVDSITLSAIPDHAPEAATISHQSRSRGLQFARAVESSLRCLNGLIEKLHHSTYLYILYNELNFVTMSKYVYAFALLGGPVVLHGFVTLRDMLNKKKNKKKKKKVKRAGSVPRPSQSGSTALIPAFSFTVSLLTSSVLSFVLPTLLHTSVPALWAQSVVRFAVLALCFVVPLSCADGVRRRWLRTEGGVRALQHEQYWRAVKCFVCLMMAVMLPPLSILNFSLVVFTALIVSPLIMFSSPLKASGGLCAWLSSFLLQVGTLVTLSPLPLTLLLRLGSPMHEPVTTPAALAIGAFHLVDDFLRDLPLDCTRNLLYVVVFFAYLPVFVTCTLLTCYRFFPGGRPTKVKSD